MQKKTTDTLTMTSKDRNIVSQTDNIIGLTRHERHCNQTRTTDQEEKRKSPRIAFLKICTNAHLQSRTSQPITRALQKSQNICTK